MPAVMPVQFRLIWLFHLTFAAALAFWLFDTFGMTKRLWLSLGFLAWAIFVMQNPRGLKRLWGFLLPLLMAHCLAQRWWGFVNSTDAPLKSFGLHLLTWETVWPVSELPPVLETLEFLHRILGSIGIDRLTLLVWAVLSLSLFVAMAVSLGLCQRLTWAKSLESCLVVVSVLPPVLTLVGILHVHWLRCLLWHFVLSADLPEAIVYATDRQALVYVLETGPRDVAITFPHVRRVRSQVVPISSERMQALLQILKREAFFFRDPLLEPLEIFGDPPKHFEIRVRCHSAEYSVAWNQHANDDGTYASDLMRSCVLALTAPNPAPRNLP